MFCNTGKSEIITLACNDCVILALGSLSTPHVLFNSGIGPKAQIEKAQESGVTVPPQREWINLPVGVGLKDHPIFSIYVKTNRAFGLFNTASVINRSDVSSISQYQKDNSILTQGKHGLIFFTSNKIDGQM